MHTPQAHPEPTNPLGIDGIEFIEYASAEPLAFGALLEQLGFVATARHRSREVTQYRQGSMNVIVNADARALQQSGTEPRSTIVSAIALRVRDADAAYRHAVDQGAWPIPTRAGVMELNIPGVHGPGDSILYFVDRFRDFSIYDVDFKPIAPTPAPAPAPAPAPSGSFSAIPFNYGRKNNCSHVRLYHHSSFKIIMSCCCLLIENIPKPLILSAPFATPLK